MRSGGNVCRSSSDMNSKAKRPFAVVERKIKNEEKCQQYSTDKECCKSEGIIEKSKRWSVNCMDKTELIDIGVNILPDAEHYSNKNMIKVNKMQQTGDEDNSCLENQLKEANEMIVRSRLSLHKRRSEKDIFKKLSDEIVLIIMQYLPKRSLLLCAQVCQRWRRISYDSSLWQRIDCSGRVLHTDVMYNVFTRNPRILRMAQVEIQTPLFKVYANNVDDIAAKVECLDLSMAVVEKEDLALLLSKCKELRKLSLEHCIADENVCKSVSQNKNLETLNLSQCYELDSNGLTYILDSCKKLESLNLQWTGLSQTTVEIVCKKMVPDIKHLNLAGCFRNISDNMVEELLKRCQKLIELDLSDCILLTEKTADNLLKYAPNIVSLSLSRCYRIAIALYRVVMKPSLKYLNIFGLLQETPLQILGNSAPLVKLNTARFSTVARPTVGIRRTSIWGLRVREC